MAMRFRVRCAQQFLQSDNFDDSIGLGESVSCRSENEPPSGRVKALLHSVGLSAEPNCSVEHVVAHMT